MNGMEKKLTPLATVGLCIPGKMDRKVFDSSIYTQNLSRFDRLSYQDVKLSESVSRTESVEKTDGVPKKKPVVLLLANHDVWIYNLRLELVERLLNDGYEVHISSPYGKRIDDLVNLGTKYHSITINRHGLNPVEELSLIREYKRLMDQIHPCIVFGYTIKPNIYGAIAAKSRQIPFVANITGLGTAVENGGWKQRVTVALYHYAFTAVQRVFFQNEENMSFFASKRIAVGKYALLPGSGVNLERYPASPYPSCGDGISGEPIRFAFISRIMKEKGIEQYLTAAEALKKDYPATEFHVCGFCEDEYEGRLNEMNLNGTVVYHGMIRDVAGFMAGMHCIVHPSYYPEGMSNVLLEACSCARPVITTDRAGCREVLAGESNGFKVPERDSEALTAAIRRFISLPFDEKEAMGVNARKVVAQKFDRSIVVDAYMKEIK